MNNVLNEMNVLFEKIENTNDSQTFNDILKRIALFCENPKMVECLWSQCKGLRKKYPSIKSEVGDCNYQKIFQWIVTNVVQNIEMDFSHIRGEFRDKNNTVIVISYLPQNENKLENLIEICRKVKENIGGNIILINTNDEIIEASNGISKGNHIEKNDMYKNEKMLMFGDIPVEYLQLCGATIEERSIVLKFIREIKPFYVINVNEDNVLVELINKMIPVYTIGEDRNDIAEEIERCKIFEESYDDNVIKNVEKRISNLKVELQGSKNPTFSVNCFTYNQEDTIADAIISFLSQETSYTVEIFVHDDASTDLTAEIVRVFENKFPKLFNVIYQKENQYSTGKSMLECFAMPNINGKYISWCEGDDYWCDNKKLQIQGDYLEKHADCVGVCCAGYEDNKGNLRKYQGYDKEGDISTEEAIVQGGGIVVTAGICLRKSIFEKVPNFVKLAKYRDYSLQILATLKGKFHFMDRIMAVYRVNQDNSWTSNLLKNSEKHRKQLYDEIKILVELDNNTNGEYQEAIEKVVSLCGYRMILDKKEGLNLG